MLRALAFLLFLPSALWAGEWVDMQTPSGSARAYLALPQGPGPFPGVVYNHGTLVRKDGHQKAAGRGYDVTAFAEALAQAGFAALAPVRSHLANAGYGAAVEKGTGVAHAALDFLKKRQPVDPARLGLMGFSEGGLISLWTAAERKDLAALVLMSPATLHEAGDRQLKAAARRNVLSGVTAPVMVTLGTKDNKSILKVVGNRLVPNLQALGKEVTVKDTYPADHKWFWRPRPAYFKDILEFLKSRLM